MPVGWPLSVTLAGVFYINCTPYMSIELCCQGIFQEPNLRPFKNMYAQEVSCGKIRLSAVALASLVDGSLECWENLCNTCKV